MLALDDTPHAIALGAAIGMFFGLTPTVGMQTVEVIIFALLTRRLFYFNRAAAMALIYISNPVTVAPIFYGLFQIGTWFVPGEATLEQFRRILAFDGVAGWWLAVKDLTTHLGLPLAVGTLVVAPVGAVGTYPMTRLLLKWYRGSNTPTDETVGNEKENTERPADSGSAHFTESARARLSPGHPSRPTCRCRTKTGSKPTSQLLMQTTRTSQPTAVHLTAPGRGAVATVRVRGESSENAAILDAAFTTANGMAARSAPVNRVLFGSWRGEDVVVVRTAEYEWEIHCHGGEAAVSRILNEFSMGAATAPPKTIFESLLLQTQTQKTARLALAQATGCLHRALRNAADCSSSADLAQKLQSLLEWESAARHLNEPWQVVIAGPTNVGKSSLLNAIAGYERSIVYDQPGTTRDTVRTELVLNGWLFQLADTAGIRSTSGDPVEAAGIRRAKDLLQTAEAVLIAVDGVRGWEPEHRQLIAEIAPSTPRTIVVCKTDLGRSMAVPVDVADLEMFETSAVRRTGLRELCAWLTRTLIPIEPSLSTALPVVGSADLCRGVLKDLNDGAPLDPLRQQLRMWCSCF